jgi:hypothetical protein
MAWQRISPEVIVQGFKKCCISNAMDENDDMLWNGSAEDGHVGGSVRKMKALKSEDGNSDTDWYR